MTQPLSYAIEASVPRRSAGVYVAWGIIVAVVSLALISSTRTQRRPLTSGGIQLEMTCRYAVGAKSVYEKAPTSNASMATLSAQARSSAVGAEDDLRTVPVIAELEGHAAARDALARLRQQNPGEELKKDAEILSVIYAETPTTITPAESARLISRHGWFGELAVSAAPAPSGALRQKVMGDAKRTFVTLLSAGVLILISCVAGFVLLVVVIVRWALGKLPPRYPPMASSPRSADVFVEAFAVYLAFMVLISLPHLFIAKLTGLTWDILLIVPIAAAIIWTRMRGIEWTQLGSGAGWTRGQGVAREMAAGVVGYIAGLPVIAVGFMLAGFLGKISHQQLSHPIVHYIQDAGPNRILLFLLACVFAPVAEETMFRGFLFGHVRLRHGWLVSTIVVSVIFAAIHPQGWPAIPVLGSIAIVLAGLREQRGSLIASMTAHALNNFGALVMLILAVG